MKHRDQIELWGGAECSICRIGDTWRDQSDETGHRLRRDDLLRIKDLGINVIRFPIVWEASVSATTGEYEFGWVDQQVELAESLGIELIAGLIHHGSGPPGTNLLDPNFPDLLAEYAGVVADRYPHITRWTPVNEPLTTARFSALYGHWYPHHQNFKSFARALVNQCLGVARSMEKIRARIPGAKLIQTEDIGKIFAAPKFQYQADYENERRWLSLDLLFGRVDANHPLRPHLLRAGIKNNELLELSRGDSSPDIVGVNYYLTSERYLAVKSEQFGRHPTGGNGRHAYVDCEAVRLPELEPDLGIGRRLAEVWDRYQTPIAITEVHHGCTREEQLRWLDQIWSEAKEAAASGIDLRAVTVWSLFGHFDWRSLLTKNEKAYDVGVFDVRCDPPRETALAKAVRCYATGREFDHAVLTDPGWWQRPARFYTPGEEQECTGRPILILGATGTLGKAFARTCKHRGLAHRVLNREEARIDSEEDIRRAIDKYDPWAVINAAGYVRVADAHREVADCLNGNAHGSYVLAKLGNELQIPVVGFSSDLVFRGDHGPYHEYAARFPACVYGASKVLAEEAMLDLHPQGLMVRTAAFFGPWDVHNFAHKLCSSLARGLPATLAKNVIVSPTYVPDLCHAVLDLLVDGEQGLWNMSNGEAVSWHEFGCRLAKAFHLDERLITSFDDLPRDTSLISSKAQILRPLDEAIADYARQVSFSARQLASVD